MNKQVPEYPDYEVTDEGLVFNRTTGRKLKPWLTKGYGTVTLCREGRRMHQYVHRLVALLFVPNTDNLPTVNHKDGDRLNNSVGNLEWMTLKDNHNHAVETNLHPRGSQKWNSKLDEDTVHNVCRLLQDGVSKVDVRSETGLNCQELSRISTRRKWRHISSNYKW